MDQELDPRRVEYLPVTDLEPDPRNPKNHSVDVIDQSIGRFGVLDLIVRDERTGKIISGHGRQKVLAGMEERGEAPPEGVKINSDGRWLVPVVTGWASRTDAEASAALIALNRTTELGGWVDDALLDLLDDLGEVDGGLVGVGFAEEDLDHLREQLDSLDGDDLPPVNGVERAEHVGEHLMLVDVSWGEPNHVVHHGQVWRLGDHVLVIAKIADEHDLWSPYLPGRIFCPYPEPYLPLSTKANEDQLLMVQPVKYLAGHLLDKYASVHGGDSVQELER